MAAVSHSNAGECCDISVLGYLVGSLKKSPRDVVKKIALSHFCHDEIKTAKQALWSSSACVPAIGPWKPRKGSSNKPRQEFEIDDIFDALSKLDEASVKPVIHVPALDLDLLPPMNPAQLLPVIFLDKMNEMEAKMAAMQAQIDNLGKREQVSGHGRNEMAHRSTSRVRKAAKEAEVIVGTKVDEGLSASNPIKHLFVNRLNNYHGVDDMKSFLLKNQVQARGIKKTSKDEWMKAYNAESGSDMYCSPSDQYLPPVPKSDKKAENSQPVEESDMNKLKLCTFNVHGVHNKWTYLQELLVEHDILFIQEHWLRECQFRLFNDNLVNVNFASVTPMDDGLLLS
ncbi:hypothetical protein CAPTEDRAFT_190762 [Capitella teleta]|uniref:Endonuclease/exonuclease/phosphatase domain-containing protein n=1 Tax=Capitella teleta TaxID=283909 RepID=R7V781_CAPTE|nr:hypothetical protein CAPTEDRAFT_190762 [Capitella teleta]|eukprot:ELU14434.1 hypothetical protein CAPTEDRAFT_190762 [Capitella teleta]